MANLFDLNRNESVEIIIPSGSTATRYNFPDLPNLRDAIIERLEIYTTTTLSATPLSGSAPMATADLKKCFLTLYQGDKQVLYRLPVLTLHRMAQSTDPYVFELYQLADVQNISFTKSFIEFPTAPATTNVAFYMVIYYRKPELNK
jgi:hypothetical protein